MKLRVMGTMLVLLGAASFGTVAGGRADAVIHEIVAAYCSGGDVGVIDEHGELLPPPLTDMEGPAFARPVIASGAVDTATFTVTDKPNTKFEEGSSVFALDSSNVDHPSANHCPRNALP